MTRRYAAVALGLLLVLTGCASAPSAAPAPTTPAAPAPTPTPTETTAPVLVPTIPFGGDCSRVLRNEQLDELMGPGWMTREEMFESYGDNAPADFPTVDSLGTLGGLACWWYGNDGMLALGVTLLPATSVPEQFARDYAAVRCDPSYDISGCRLGVTENETWIMAALYSPEGSDEDFLESAVQTVADTVSGPLDAQAADRQPGWWTLPDCVSLGEEMALAELLGEGYINGYWEGAEAPEQTLLTRAGVEVYCPWFTNQEQDPDAAFVMTNLTLAAGAARDWPEIRGAAGAETIPVDGAAEAVFIHFPPHAFGALYATDGANVLRVEGEPDFAVQLAERALAAVGD